MITSQYKKDITLSLKKAQGMIVKLQQMLDEDLYCADIAMQVSATIGLLKRVNTQLLKNHLLCCGKNKLTSPDTGQVKEFIEELVKVWNITSSK
ncbi:MAG: metal-sensitive transcriptional regulator [bacterium]|nr:metal-sensitive transcriptional regulator [bacterium]